MKHKKTGFVISVLFFLSVCAFSFTAGDTASAKNREISVKSTEDALHRAVTRYYRVNGVYPSDADSLCKEYGIVYNSDEISIKYVLFSSNIYPDITIIKK